MKKNPWRRKLESGEKFSPGHEFIAKSIDAFLTRGGKITVLNPALGVQTSNNDKSLVDEFLMGRV